ncbi:hypothetical protein Cgig2_022183 [Carnegiea gigantea]|uniref:Uncharacterized protein n=1 Tax=Carnegiea gigantea TaxID=171969 RepID=A0A9Q1GP25_9CARY|nr:hypothetical protein Cgig2_022183 [Carnegiea gigantea]
MGLSDTDTLEKKGKSPVGKLELLLESFLRKDDVFYEELKKIVEKCFGIQNHDTEQHTTHDCMEFRNIRHMSRILTEDSVVFEKTCPQMEKVVRMSLEVLQGTQSSSNQANIRSQKNFRHNHVNHLTLTLKSHHDAIMRALDGLGDMPTLTLSAMYRKLKCVHGYVPRLRPPKSGWNRDRLIEQVRMMSLEMVGQLGDFEVLPEPLAKAMAIASLNSKLVSSYEDLSMTRFVHVTPEAIHILGQRTKRKSIEKLLGLLDPKSGIGTVGAKAIKNILIDINKKPSHRLSSKDLIDEQVEEVLNSSATIKQILLDNILGDKLDEEFADAHMEELVESDDGDFFDDDDDDDDYKEEEQLRTGRMYGVQTRLNNFNEEVQSTGDTHDINSSSSQGDSYNSLLGAARCFGDDEYMSMAISVSETSSGKEVEQNKLVDLDNCAASSRSGSSCLERNQMSESHNNVAIQEVSDQASLTLYWLVGHMMG